MLSRPTVSSFPLDVFGGKSPLELSPMGKRGPKRDPEVRQRILDATRELICARGPKKVTINEITEHAGVAKQTIYRWWPTKSALVIDMHEQIIRAKSTFPDTGSAYNDTQLQMREMTRLFASPIGSIIKELIADSQGDPTLADQFRDGFFSENRNRAASITNGMERGELRDDIDVETVIDMLYGPIWLRMLIGHQPLTEAATDRILDHAWPALVRQPTAARA